MLTHHLLTLEQLVPTLAVQFRPGLMIPHARIGSRIHSHSIPVTSGTDYGICAKIVPQTFESASEVPVSVETYQTRLSARPGVANGINNGLHIVLDAEVYDYMDNRR